MLDEVNYLTKVLNHPTKPFTAILGGAKVSDKINVIENLIHKCDNILIGGGMAFTFLKASGYEIGISLCEEDKIELTQRLMAEAEKAGVKLLLPCDIAVAPKFEDTSEFIVVPASQMPAEFMGLDIGPASVKEFGKIINNSGTIIWNGPMGVFEFDNFAKGTFKVAEYVAEATGKGALSVIGGGDSASAIKKLGFEKKVSYISTGGGATLEFLEGKVLPGIQALETEE